MVSTKKDQNTTVKEDKKAEVVKSEESKTTVENKTQNNTNTAKAPQEASDKDLDDWLR